MGRIHISINSDIEKQFKKTFELFKKGDFSFKIEELMKGELKISESGEKKERKLISKFITDLDNLFLKFYKCDEFSLVSANKAALEWDKIKQKYN